MQSNFHVLQAARMAFSEIVDQPRVVDMLSSALRAKSVHHAWLFQGPDGAGKEVTAVALAQALTCVEKPSEGCGACASCQRVARRNHPDVVWIMPEDEMVRRGFAARSDFDRVPSREIRIDQIRQLQERLALRALEAPRKIAIIVSAQAMNVAAQNALLKTLEEPPADTHLILVSAAADRLLATIRSRCAKAQFGPPKPAAIDAKALALQKEVIDGFEQLVASDARGWLRYAETWGEERTSAENALTILNTWLRDVAVAQIGSTDFINDDLSDLARIAAKKVSPFQLERRASLIAETQQAISQRNGAARLQLERMLIRMFSSGINC